MTVSLVFEIRINSLFPLTLTVSVMKRTAPPDTPTQTGGNPLFDFNLTPAGLPRRWRDVVHRERFRTHLAQNREPLEQDDLGQELTSALRRAIETQLRTMPNLQPHHTVHFTMQSDHLSHAFQSTTFTVQEFQDDSERLRTYLQALASKLNSNEDFEVDDSFTIETTMVRTPGRGGRGRRDRSRQLGRTSLEKLLKRKKSVVRILNEDDLCCARAIVTMKALADATDARDPDYTSLRRGLPVQQRAAQALHLQAGVPEGPCGPSELQKFQDVLSDYQIKVLSIDKPHMITFAGPLKDKKILLIKVGEHYHGCTSYSAFLDRSYFCHKCDRAYNTEDHSHHSCDGKCCFVCGSGSCDDFKNAKSSLPPDQHPKPTRLCSSGSRHFFGDQCYERHLQSTTTTRSICETTKKCLACCMVYDAAPYKRAESASHPKYKHTCGVAECPFCQKYVPQDTHQCFIQPLDESEDQRKIISRPMAEVGDRAVLGVDPDTGFAYVEANAPLFVYADYEATTNQDGVQTPIMVCCESAEEDETHVHYGEDCTETFFDYLDEQTVDEYGDTRNVIVIFHNFKGYDGMFIVKYLYDNHRDVEDQITVGCKILSLRNHELTFKDSLCFLPFPLASFPATFGLTEQCKGFFPHLFNTQENQDYEGPMPPAEMYDPEGMSAKKKAEFERWYAAKVAANYVFNLRQEMEAYCISDVKLLKAGCEKFQTEFEGHADFNPMEKCITIASSCNCFWRKKLLRPNTIAVEPPRGWHGAQTNTSRVARQWLAYENHKLRVTEGEHDLVHPDRIRTATNGGEVGIYTPAQSFLVDGFDESTNTVYEFHGCL